MLNIQLGKTNFHKLERFFKGGDRQGFDTAIDELSLQGHGVRIWQYLCWLRYKRFIKKDSKKTSDKVRRKVFDKRSSKAILDERNFFNSLINAYNKDDAKVFQGLLKKNNLTDFYHPIIASIYTLERTNETEESPSNRRCKVRIDAIKFNHDPFSHTNDALNIRKNFREEVTAPEWNREGEYALPEESTAAYSISDIGKNRVTIKVRFSMKSPNNTRQIEIKARGGGILGEVKPMIVNFVYGVSSPEYIEFILNDNHIGDATVNVENIKWQWMCRCIKHKKWYNIQKTKHRIYTVLKEPVMPWKQHPYPDAQNPWSEVLDFSCEWARGTNSVDAAAAAITTMVNLPVGKIEYDNINGSAHYAGPRVMDPGGDDPCARNLFYCTFYLERLKGGHGNGKYVNCTDCASIVCTFSNILGCKLWESIMYNAVKDEFGLNEIMAIGSGTWGKPFKDRDSYGVFSFHEVAWKGAAELNDRIFDACMKVNGSEIGGTRTPDPIYKIPSLPLNIAFDDSSSFDYRERLVASAFIKDCLPVPTRKIRREVV